MIHIDESHQRMHTDDTRPKKKRVCRTEHLMDTTERNRIYLLITLSSHPLPLSPHPSQ